MVVILGNVDLRVCWDKCAPTNLQRQARKWKIQFSKVYTPYDTRPLLSNALDHGPGITVSLNPAGTPAGKRFLPKRRPHASPAKPAMALSRLIPEIKAWRSCLRGSCTSQESAIDSGSSPVLRKLRGEVRENLRRGKDLRIFPVYPIELHFLCLIAAANTQPAPARLVAWPAPI